MPGKAAATDLDAPMRCSGRSSTPRVRSGCPTSSDRATALIAELAVQVDNEGSGGAPGTNDVGPVVALTAREREILDCLVDGLSNAEIGRALHISANTAANHVRAILLKTGCSNRTEAATWAVRKGVVPN